MLKKTHTQFIYEEKPELKDMPLTIESIKNQVGESDDIVFKDILIGENSNILMHLGFVDGLINGKNFDDDILKPLIQEPSLAGASSETALFEAAANGTIYHNTAQIRDSLDECIEDMLSGSVILVFNSLQKAITFEIKGFQSRSISEPSSENVIKGSKDSFVEIIRTNTATIRNKIKTQNLRIKQSKIGWQTYTTVAVVYIEGIANRDVIDEVQKRIDSIQDDGALSAAAIEEYIVDKKFSLFPQADYTERPDKLCANLLEGRVAILIDGLPIVYMVPTTFPMIMQAAEDYAYNYFFASAIRIIRYLSLLITLLVPAYYIAVASFHIDMIPSSLAISIIKSKADVPFPTFAEVTFMLLAFELLIEAGIRMPKTFGATMSILGALVVGQAAVSAKFISPAVLVVIALSGIAGFAIPNHDLSNTVRILRFVLIISASIAGLVGVMLCLIGILCYMSTLESYGVSYLSPVVGTGNQEMYGDTIFRLPLSQLKFRPKELQSLNKRRKK